MVKIETFEELESLLQEWMSFHDPSVYDLGGMVSLLGACLDNLKMRMVPGEVEDLLRYLSTDQVEFITWLSSQLIKAQVSRPQRPKAPLE